MYSSVKLIFVSIGQTPKVSSSNKEINQIQIVYHVSDKGFKFITYIIHFFLNY